MYKIVTFLLVMAGIINPSFADVALANAKPWQLGLQEAASPVMERLTQFHDFMLVIITVITIFILLLLAYVCVRFSAKKNPTPSKTSHNTLIEIIWTAVPILILILIAVPSFKNLYYINQTPETELTVKVVGYQWYWGYQYPEHDIEYESRPILDKEALNGEPYLLAVDNKVVVPVNTNVKILLTGADVIHNWAIPALGVKIDAIPGRVNETWFRATREGIFYGQCSELCGVGHGFMPIAVEVVSKEKFKKWITLAKEKYASLPVMHVAAR